MSEIKIGRKDVVWNYVATFLKIGVGVILLPFILRVFPQETVAVWNIFIAIIALSSLFDFGFNPSFARNISYVISGVKELKTIGFQTIDNKDAEIDYGLLKGLIDTMRWFYARMALVLFSVLVIAGTMYIHNVLKTYSGDVNEVYIAWIILIIVNSYSFYTMYYDSLLQGMGLIKVSKQIEITGQAIYLTIAASLILLHFNLIAIVSAQAFSIIIRRILSHKTIYTADFKAKLQTVSVQPIRQYIKPILPNAVKLGLTSLGSFFLTKSSLMIGALYLSLDNIASYGITTQIVGIISGIGFISVNTYLPKVSQHRVYNDIIPIKRIYIKSSIILVITYMFLGFLVVFSGNSILNSLHSTTKLLPESYILLILLISLLETYHSAAGNFLLTKNEVPFFKASIISGLCTFGGVFLLLHYTTLGLTALVIVPLLVDVSYQSWKWPWEVIKDLKPSKNEL
ncbi:MAG: hypothetical protein LBE91_08005 [Tannerella sp.]|jgi:O-antigen/teichoic acid export membrane protein|nr:hypothetical protein [Tannerella sp.]